MWEINQRITEITHEFVRANIPPGATEVVIPEGVEYIGDGAFSAFVGGLSLEILSIESVKIPKSVKSIGKLAFAHCINLKWVDIADGVASIGDRAFVGSGLQSVLIPGSIQSFGEEVFSACINLELAVICSGVSYIGKFAFYKCTSLKSIVILDKVGIALLALSGCTSLNSIVLPGEYVQNSKLLGTIGIFPGQNVIKYSDFIEGWKNSHGLKGKTYADPEVLFLYELQNVESFDLPWNEVIKQYPGVGVADIKELSGGKQNCKPAWAREGYQGLSNNKVYLEDRSTQLDKGGNQVFKRFNKLGDEISPYLSAREAAALACVSKNKDILIPSVSSQSFFSSLCLNAGTSKVFALSMCAVLAIGVGISYMQRYSAVDPLSL